MRKKKKKTGRERERVNIKSNNSIKRSRIFRFCIKLEMFNFQRKITWHHQVELRSIVILLLLYTSHFLSLAVLLLLFLHLALPSNLYVHFAIFHVHFESNENSTVSIKFHRCFFFVVVFFLLSVHLLLFCLYERHSPEIPPTPPLSPTRTRTFWNRSSLPSSHK